MLCSIIKHLQTRVRMKRLQKNRTDVFITPNFIHYQALLCFHFSADAWVSRELEGSFPKKALKWLHQVNIYYLQMQFTLYCQERYQNLCNKHSASSTKNDVKRNILFAHLFPEKWHTNFSSPLPLGTRTDVVSNRRSQSTLSQTKTFPILR